MESLNGGFQPTYIPVPTIEQAQDTNIWASDLAIMEAARRLSRQHSGQRSGTVMRVSKPSSANNSPGTSIRRGMANEGQSHRRVQQHQEQLYNKVNRPARPMSWHPGSQMFTPQPYALNQQAFQPLTPTIYAEQQDYSGAYPTISPVMASYSNNTSPCSAFSPLPLADYQNCPPQYLNQTWDLQPSRVAQYLDSLPALTHSSSLDTPAANNMDWSSYMPHGLSNTSPPTPDSFVGLPQSQPALSEDAVPYEALDKSEDEEEGEILVGMGLYDTPDKYEEDPQLNNYLSTAGSLLGASYQRQEPTGKGLKLEETWVPPQSDDDDDDESSDDEDDEAPKRSASETAC